VRQVDAEASASRTRAAGGTAGLTRLGIAGALLSYPLAQLVLRLAVSEALEGDESFHLVVAQILALGVVADATQPPLYTWLQILFLELFGVSTFAVAGLRTLLQSLTVIALYGSARALLPGRAVPVLAALSFWLIAEFSVESLRKSHSVLVTCLASLMFWLLIRVWKSGRTGEYLLLGGVLGLGCLAKYNFPLVAATLLVAAATLPEMRARLRDRRMLVAVSVAVIVAAPHLAWIATHASTVGAHVGRRLATAASAGPGFTLAVYRAMPLAVLAYLYPWAIYLVVFWRSWAEPTAAATTARRLIERFWALAFGAFVLGLPLLDIGKFPLHWLQPILCVAPIYLFLRWPPPPWPARRTAVFAGVVVGGLVLGLGQRALEVWGLHPLTQSARINDPFPAVAAQIRAAGFRGGVIITPHHAIGGNLRFLFPGSVVITYHPPMPPRIPPGPCLIAWDTRFWEGVPPTLRTIAPVSAGPGGPPVRYAEAHGPRGRRDYRVGFVIHEECR
jgi:4-amino-4-deoxy-L-arabinose transferase-like glycosyltransferase